MARISEATLYKKLAELGHAHFCNDRSCRRVYDCLDVACLKRCAEPRKNGLCEACRGARVPVWSAGRQLRSCCRNNSTQITDRDELLARRLAGTGPWFKCKTCSRAHGWPQGFRSTNEKE